jgi:hypothetical protein
LLFGLVHAALLFDRPWPATETRPAAVDVLNSGRIVAKLATPFARTNYPLLASLFPEVRPMANTHAPTMPTPRVQIVQFVLTVLSTLLQALLGSILSISTALTFGVFALVVLADMSFGVAITLMAVGMNAMLFSLLLLGSILPDRPTVAETSGRMVKPSR